jgi:CHAT domain-containing protein
MSLALGAVLLAALRAVAGDAGDTPAHVLLARANAAIEGWAASRLRGDGPGAAARMEEARAAAAALAARGLPLPLARVEAAAGWDEAALRAAAGAWGWLEQAARDPVRADPGRITAVLEDCRRLGDRWCEARALLARAESLAQSGPTPGVTDDATAAVAILRGAGPSAALGAALVLGRGSGEEALSRLDEAIGIGAGVGDAEVEGRARCERARADLLLRQWEAADAGLARVRDLAAARGAPRAAGCAAYVEGLKHYFQRRPLDAARVWAAFADSEDGPRAPRERLWSLVGVTAVAVERGDVVAAEARGREARQVADGLHGDDDRLRAYCNLTTALSLSGRFDQVEAVAETCLSLSRAASFPAAEQIALRGLARLAEGRGRIDEALALHRESLAITRRTGNMVDTVHNLLGIYPLLLRQGDPAGARAHVEEAVALADRIGAPDLRGRALGALAWLEAEAGDPGAAERLAGEALALLGPQGAPMARAWASRARANALYRRGDYAAALEGYQRAYDALEGQPYEQAHFAIDVGNAWFQLFRLDLALERYEAALALAEATGNREARIVALSNIALLKRRTGLDERDREALLDSVRQAREAGLDRLAVSQLVELAELLGALGEPVEAEEAARRALSLAARHPDGQRRARLALAGALGRQGRSDEALRACDPALGEAVEADRQARIDALWRCGRLSLDASRPQEAVERLQEAVLLAEDARVRMTQPSLRSTFLGDRTSLYADLAAASLARAGGEPSGQALEESFRISERFRARVLLEGLLVGRGSRAGDPGTATPPAPGDRLAALAEQRLGLAPAAPGAPAPGLPEASAADSAPQLLGASPAGIEQVQAALPDGRTAAIEYLIGYDEAFAFVILRAGARAVRLDTDRGRLYQEVSRYRSLLKSRSPDPERDAEAIDALGGRLYRTLLGPIEGSLEGGVARLVVAPDGALHLLPFEALVTPGPGEVDSRFLVRRFEIVMVPSLTVFTELRPIARASTEQSLFALADPEPAAASGEPAVPPGGPPAGLPRLPYAEQEIGSAARRLGGRPRLLAGAEATEEQARAGLTGGYPIVHIAAHGFLDRAVLGSAGLVLAPAAGDDGLLQEADLIDLRATADLVVLSACSTGEGQVIGGEGVLGLPRALLQAGAPTVVMSLWQVRDRAAALFMDRFYAAIAAGDAPGPALRRAKLDLIASGRPALRHPSVWAPFVIAGLADRPVRLPPRPLAGRSNGVLAIGLLIVAGLSARFLLRSRSAARRNPRSGPPGGRGPAPAS